MRFIGVDMASQPANTGLVVLEAHTVSDQLSVVEARGRATDTEILAAITASRDHVVAIDAPLGWPTRFREQMHHWSLREWNDEIRNDLIYRATDLFVNRDLKLGSPLSVSANLIAIPAMRTRALLTHLEITALDGSERVYETYPAASLRVWHLDGIRYKGRHATPEGRVQLLRALVDRWNIQGVDLSALTVNDHVLDALICALTAREVLNHPREIPEAYRTLAREEGWIHVPVD